MASPVIGRDEELGAIEAFLAEAEQGPRALVLSGEPGIGKTILWETGVERGRERIRPRARPPSVEAEASLSFAGLSDLLAPGLRRGGVRRFAPLRRRALEVALLLAEPGEEPPDPRAIGLALLDVLPRSCRAKGRWSSRSTTSSGSTRPRRGVLQIALRRLRDEPVSLLATVRTDRRRSRSARARARAFPEERLERARARPAEPGGALHQPAQGAARARADPAGARPGAGGVGRQPVLRARARARARPDGHETRRRAGRSGAREPARAARRPPGAACPTETGDVVLFGAALARPTVELVAAAHGDREPAFSRRSTPPTREGVIELDDSSLRFAHPLLASICYEQAPLWKRRAIHRALAATVADLEERARHMALAVEGPDAAVAAELDAAAEQAAARGATARGRALRAGRRADAGRPALARSAPDSGRELLPPRRRQRADGGDARGAPPRDSAGCGAGRRPPRARRDASRPRNRRRSRSWTRRWPRRRATTCASAQILAYRSSLPHDRGRGSAQRSPTAVRRSRRPSGPAIRRSSR